MSSAARLIKRAVARVVDRAYGIDTEAQVSGAELGYAEGSGNLHYQASSWLSVPGIFARWSPQPGSGDVIADIGCGKGRALVQMGRRFPVDGLIGVEYDAALAAIAETNLRRSAARLRARSYEIVVADARHFEIPTTVTVVYLANPFDGAVLTAVAERIVDSFDRRPRRLRLAYVNPTGHDALMATGRFTELDARPPGWMRIAGVDPAQLRCYEVAAG